ncbi:MAG TPA: inositol monophosphatase family protein [Longimicrobiales bacterium]|nr:inositol monophosphatase family protein [Longimicrobiales bacterium]
MSNCYRDLLAFATEVAWRAGRLTLAHFQTGIVAETKPDDSPVTEADRDAERLIRDLIGRRFPHDGILGEETGETRPGADRRWIVDPIDGTRSYVRGVPLYGVMLALEEEGDPVLGLLHFPALAETVSAARGVGCWWNGRRALVSDETHLERALVLTTDLGHIEQAGFSRGWNRLSARAGMVRTWGDCYGHALLATGRAEAMLDPVMQLWDAAALVPIVEEAGGVITGWGEDADWRGGSVVATSAALANDVRELLHQDRSEH